MNIGIDFDKFQKQEVAQVMTNYTKMPNSIIDDRIMARISDKAFKCLMFVMRQTMGFNRASHTIATTQFQKYCGIKKEETVAKVIRELEQCKLITVERKAGCLSTYSLTLNQYHETGLPPSNGTTPIKGGYTTPVEQGYTTPAKGGSIKETLKENIKEIHTLLDSPKNSVDEILNLWKPNLHSLNSWLQRAGEKPLTQDEMENILLEVNAHYERHIRSDAVSDSKMYSNFVKWVKGDFSKNKKVKQNSFGSKPKTALQVTKDQWAEERFAQQQSTVIDVNQDQVLIGGEREYF